MAKEILAKLDLQLRNLASAPAQVVTNPKTISNGLTIDQTEKTRFANTQTIPFAAQVALLKGSVVNVGIGYFRNVDANNFVRIGIEVGGTFHPTVELGPGEEWAFRLATSAPFAQADTGDVKLDYELWGD